MPDPTRFILMHTSHGGNVGAAARAMKVMGFSDLVLVRPRFADVLSREDTIAFASGAADVLARARIVDTLAEALDGITQVCATARNRISPMMNPTLEIVAPSAVVECGVDPRYCRSTVEGIACPTSPR